MVQMEEPLIVFPFFRLYKDGRIDRLRGEDFVPPSPEEKSGVRSKDVVVSPKTGLTARIFLPRKPDPTRKLPLVFFLHGGAFCIETPFSARYHNHAVAIAEEADVIVVSVHYRRAPEHPLPAAYDDTWEALTWLRSGSEAWVDDYADLGRVFVVGVSAGATLAHFVTRQAGLAGGPSIAGLVLAHPYFLSEQPDKLVEAIYPKNTGLADPRLSAANDPELGKLGCRRVLVFVAEEDFLRDRGLTYYEALKKSDWKGDVELVETEGEGHVFYVSKADSENARALMKKLVSFLKR